MSNNTTITERRMIKIKYSPMLCYEEDNKKLFITLDVSPPSQPLDNPLDMNFDLLKLAKEMVTRYDMPLEDYIETKKIFEKCIGWMNYKINGPRKVYKMKKEDFI